VPSCAYTLELGLYGTTLSCSAGSLREAALDDPDEARWGRKALAVAKAAASTHAKTKSKESYSRTRSDFSPR
jgi:hypothetical protein